MKHVRKMTAKNETGPALAGIEDYLGDGLDDFWNNLLSGLGIGLISTPFGKFIKLPSSSSD